MLINALEFMTYIIAQANLLAIIKILFCWYLVSNRRVNGRLMAGNRRVTGE